MKHKTGRAETLSSSYKLIARELGSVRVKFDELLKYHSAGGLNSIAECFYIATSVKELTQVLNLADELKIPFIIFGAGTKVSLTDEDLKGLIIKNRTSGIKISGVKGKVSVNGIGVVEAMVEVESGVSLQKLNEFLKDQGLQKLSEPLIPLSTVGGSLYITPSLQEITQKIKVWSDTKIFDIDILELKDTDIILSAIIKVKSAK